MQLILQTIGTVSCIATAFVCVCVCVLVQDSIKKVPEAVERLTPLCDFVAYINNNDSGDPVLDKIYTFDEGKLTMNNECDWDDVKERFNTHPDLYVSCHYF